MNTKGTWVPLSLLIILSLIWGTSFILIKQGLKAFDPEALGALRVSAASIFLFPLAVTRLRQLNSDHYAKLLLSGLLSVFLPAFLFAFAQTRIASSVTGIANSLTPLLTLIVGAVLFHQRFQKSSVIGILIGLTGTVILITAGRGHATGGLSAYALLIIIACIFYAINLNLVKYKIPDLQSLTITSVSIVLVGPPALIYLFAGTHFLETFEVKSGAWTAFGYIVFLAFMSTAVAIVLLNKLVKISSPLFTSSVNYFIPVVAVIWGVLDGERLYVSHYVGMAAIIGGVYLANARKSKGGLSLGKPDVGQHGKVV
jgi:drug/metabolite transporter (DMT)-like permease